MTHKTDKTNIAGNGELYPRSIGNFGSDARNSEKLFRLQNGTFRLMCWLGGLPGFIKSVSASVLAASHRRSKRRPLQHHVARFH